MKLLSYKFAFKNTFIAPIILGCDPELVLAFPDAFIEGIA